MSVDRGLPHLSEDLVRELDREIPPPRFNPNHAIEDIMFRSGKRAVVDALLTRLSGPTRLEEDMNQ